MHAHIIHAHPEPGSYNSALTKTARHALKSRGDTVSVSDLCAEGFDPVERAVHYPNRADPDTFAALNEQRHSWNTGTVPKDVSREIERLQAADLVVLQFPLWWHGPPAVLKGWMDRVFMSGGLYTSRMRYDTGYFKERRAMVSVTTGAPEHAFGPGSRGGDFDVMLWPIQYSLHYMGFTVLPPFISYGVQGHGYSYEDKDSLEQRLKNNLDAWGTRLSHIENDKGLVFPGWDDWDEGGAANS